MYADQIIYLIAFMQLLSISFVFFSSQYSDSSYIGKLLKKIPMATSLLTATGILFTVLIFRNQYGKSIVETTLKTTDDALINVHELCNNNYQKCPDFINSLDFNFDSSLNHSQANYTKKMIAIKIFQSIENYFVTAYSSSTSDSEWMSTFLSYCNSDELYQIWHNIKFNFGIKSRAYIEKLFEINRAQKFSNSEDVIKYCNNFVKSDEFKKIISIEDDTIVTLK